MRGQRNLFILADRADYGNDKMNLLVDSMNHYRRGEYESLALEEGPLEALKKLIWAAVAAG